MKTRHVSYILRALYDSILFLSLTSRLLGSQDEVIYRLTQPGYLHEIRKQIASKYTQEETETSKATI